MTKAVHNVSLLFEACRMSLLVFLCFVKSVNMPLGTKVSVSLIITSCIVLSGHCCSHVGMLDAVIPWNSRFKLLAVPSLEI